MSKSIIATQINNNACPMFKPTDPHIIWSDLLRIFAVFSVIVLHLAANGFYGTLKTNSFQFQICNFYNSLVRFCVPVLVMISGSFLLNPKKEYSIKKLFFKKIFRLMIAYIFWSFIYAFISQMKSPSSFCFETLIYDTLKGPFHFWFIFMISGLYIITPVLRWITQNAVLTLYCIILGLIFVFLTNAMSLIPEIGNILTSPLRRLNVNLVAGYTSYYLLGYWFSSHKLSSRTRTLLYVLGILSLLFTIIANALWSIYTEKAVILLLNELLPNTLLTTISIFVFFQYSFIHLHLSNHLATTISSISKLSFGIYLIHILIQRHLYLLPLPYSIQKSMFFIPVTAIIIFIISYFIVLFLSIIPIVNKYFL